MMTRRTLLLVGGALLFACGLDDAGATAYDALEATGLSFQYRIREFLDPKSGKRFRARFLVGFDGNMLDPDWGERFWRVLVTDARGFGKPIPLGIDHYRLEAGDSIHVDADVIR